MFTTIFSSAVWMIVTIIQIIAVLIAAIAAFIYWGPPVLLIVGAVAIGFAFCWLALPDIYSGLKSGFGRLFT